MVAWIRDGSNQGALGSAWDRVCRFQRTRPLEYIQNALDIGTPRARCPFSRARTRGAVLKAGQTLDIWPRDLPREKKGYSFRVGSDCAPKYSQPFGRTSDSIKGYCDQLTGSTTSMKSNRLKARSWVISFLVPSSCIEARIVASRPPIPVCEYFARYSTDFLARY